MPKRSPVYAYLIWNFPSNCCCKFAGG